MVGCLLNTHPFFKLERVTSLSVWEKRMFPLKVSASSYESCPLSRTCCQCSPSAILSFELFFCVGYNVHVAVLLGDVGESGYVRSLVFSSCRSCSAMDA